MSEKLSCFLWLSSRSLLIVIQVSVIRPSSDPGILGEIPSTRGEGIQKNWENIAILLGKELGIWNRKYWSSLIYHCSPLGNRRRCLFEIPKSYRGKSFCFNFKRQTIPFFSGHVVDHLRFSRCCAFGIPLPATSTGYSSSLAITFVHSKQYL